MHEARRFPRACIAAPHDLASAAGFEVLASGGNAVDAAVAANLTLAVVTPYLCGFGGDLFAQVWNDGKAHGYLGSGRAPAAATLDAVQGRLGTVMPMRGPLTVTVPGAVRGWFDLLERFGTRSFGDLARRALGYAIDGFPLTGKARLVFAFMEAEFGAGEEWRRVYGGVAERGVLVQPDLARTIEAIADGGPDAYYRGEIADAIAAHVQAEGGLLAASDLAGHEGTWVDPLRALYRDVEVLELPPPTQGVTALEALRIVDRWGELPPEGVERQHLLIEAAKLALADRAAHVTDPDHMRIDPRELLADAWIDARVAAIDPSHAIDPGRGTEVPGGTAHLSVADADGMLVSLIQTNFNEFGSGLTVPGWGINLQNRGSSFSLDPADVNVVAPGKWTVHTLIPALGLREGKPWLVFGTQGGDAQAQIHLQLLARVVDDASDLQAALDAPRWRIRPGAWTLEIEPRFGEDVLDGLAARGHEVSVVGGFDDYMGYVEAIRIEADGYAGAGDPRAESAVLGF